MIVDVGAADDERRRRGPRAQARRRPTAARCRQALEDAGIDATWIDVPQGQEGPQGDGARRSTTVPTSSSRAAATAPCGPRRSRSSARTRPSPCCRPAPRTSSPTAFGLPSKPADVVGRRDRQRPTRTIDSGVCNDRSFNVMAGAGFDAALIDDADDHKERLGMLAYVRAGLRNARGRERFDARVTVDGEPFFSRRAPRA